MDKVNVIQHMNEIRNILSYATNIGFFFGAGHGPSRYLIYYMWEVRRITSCAVWESEPSETWQGQRKLFL